MDAHAVAAAEQLPFPDRSFETVLLFEVLEHVPDYEFVLGEARRVARKNVLITVPNCGSAHSLHRAALVFDHMLELDHVNFFTRRELETSLGKLFADYEVREEEHKDPALYRLVFPLVVARGLALLSAARLVGRRFSYRLFAEARV